MINGCSWHMHFFQGLVYPSLIAVLSLSPSLFSWPTSYVPREFLLLTTSTTRLLRSFLPFSLDDAVKWTNHQMVMWINRTDKRNGILPVWLLFILIITADTHILAVLAIKVFVLVWVLINSICSYACRQTNQLSDCVNEMNWCFISLGLLLWRTKWLKKSIRGVLE